LEDGAVESSQQVWVEEPVVAMTADGARQLGASYWREVRRSTRGLVHVRESAADVQIRVIGRPTLLRFSPAEVTVTAEEVSCTYAITGGLLTRGPDGSITFTQRILEDRVELWSGITGFHPTLAARPGAPRWTGELYKQIQARLHVAISGDYFRRLIREARA
jgi:hypothetical protein